MALRKQLSDVFKMSSLFNSLACEKNVLPTAAHLHKKCHQHEQAQMIIEPRLHISHAMHDIPSTYFQQSRYGLSFQRLKTSEMESVAEEYQCPSRLSNHFSQLVILDNHTNKSDYRLPVSNSVITSVIDPSTQKGNIEIKDPVTSIHMPIKEAKEILKIRHKKMKKHKLRKLRKRMYFVWRKQKMTRKAKRDAIYWKEINEIKKDGEDFDAESFVNEQLKKARRGGYFINVFHSKV